MQNVKAVISLLETLYFKESDSTKRYELLKQVEDALQEMRKITVNEIDALADYNRSTEHGQNEAYLLAKMSKVVSDASGSVVVLVPEMKLLDVFEYGTIDSLDVVEIILNFEEILSVEITSNSELIPDDNMTIADLLSLRKP